MARVSGEHFERDRNVERTLPEFDSIIKKIPTSTAISDAEYTLFRSTVKLLIGHENITAEQGRILDKLAQSEKRLPASEMTSIATVANGYRNDFIRKNELEVTEIRLGQNWEKIPDALKTLQWSKTEQLSPEYFTTVAQMAKLVRLRLESYAPQSLTGEVLAALIRMETVKPGGVVSRSDLELLVPYFKGDEISGLANRYRYYIHGQAGLALYKLGLAEPTDRVLQALIRQETITGNDREWLIAVSRFSISKYEAKPEEQQIGRAILRKLGAEENISPP
jgi:hypothetical protein